MTREEYVKWLNEDLHGGQNHIVQTLLLDYWRQVSINTQEKLTINWARVLSGGISEEEETEIRGQLPFGLFFWEYITKLGIHEGGNAL